MMQAYCTRLASWLGMSAQEQQSLKHWLGALWALALCSLPGTHERRMMQRFRDLRALVLVGGHLYVCRITYDADEILYWLPASNSAALEGAARAYVATLPQEPGRKDWPCPAHLAARAIWQGAS